MAPAASDTNGRQKKWCNGQEKLLTHSMGRIVHILRPNDAYSCHLQNLHLEYTDRNFSIVKICLNNKSHLSCFVGVASTVLTFVAATDNARAQGADYDQPPISYSSTEPRDPLAKIKKRIEAGEKLFKPGTGPEMLAQMLKLLDVPVESQVLVYSKTSAQNAKISPERPRAVYFSDEAYVGWVQNGNLEVTTFDPKLGAIFYLVDISELAAGEQPKFNRNANCLTCHAGGPTREVPGPLVRSVSAGPTGMPEFSAGTFFVGDDTPLENRWGGWYVTGDSGDQVHRGNTIAHIDPDSDDGDIVLKPVISDPLHVDSLDEVIDTEPYLHGGRSDIVALMVLEHQVATQNTILQGSYEARRAIHRSRSLRRELGEKNPNALSETTRTLLEHQADRIVRKLLFADEFEMVDDGVEGDDSFQQAFAKNERESSEGRSLKDFRLYERLFKYRCSYLIYSSVFDNQPVPLRDAVYRRLHEVLVAPITPQGYEYLSESERERIFQIIVETKDGLPNYWKVSAETASVEIEG